MNNFKTDLEKVLNAIGANEIMKFPFNETESLRSASIDSLTLGVRATNGLRRKGVNTIGGLIDNWEDIRSWRGLGTASINEIKSNFYEYYYSTLSDEAITKFWIRFIEVNCVTAN